MTNEMTNKMTNEMTIIYILLSKLTNNVVSQ